MKSFAGGLWGSCLENFESFWNDLDTAMRRWLTIHDGKFLADNLMAWERNLSFLDDPKFMRVFAAHAQTTAEKGIIWRTHVFVWCAEQSLRRAGDLVECGCYKGTSVRIACDYIDFERVSKNWYLYDLFEHQEGMLHHAMPEHGPSLYTSVQNKFRDTPNVKVIQGKIPEIFEKRAPPDRIAFLHLDMNNADAEIGALAALFDKMSPGSLILLDDYGWIHYRDQKLAHDEFFAAHGLRPVELPTGQGLVLI